MTNLLKENHRGGIMINYIFAWALLIVFYFIFQDTDDDDDRDGGMMVPSYNPTA